MNEWVITLNAQIDDLLIECKYTVFIWNNPNNIFLVFEIVNVNLAQLKDIAEWITIMLKVVISKLCCVKKCASIKFQT